MTTITCPCCDGTGGSTVDDLGSMEPAYVTGCHVCHGTHYIDTVAFTKAMLLETTDIYEAAGKAATDTPAMKESQCLARIREISQYWVDHFRPCMEDDNNYYRGEGRIDGKDAAMIGEDFQEVLQLSEILSANQERLVGYALHCESEIRRLAKMLEETHDQFIDESHRAITEDRFQYEVARILEEVQP